jgi:multiple sugar transport system permease protein
VKIVKSDFRQKSFLSQEPLIAIFAAPLIAGVFVVSIVPTLMAALTAFTDLELGLNARLNFIGFENFLNAFTNTLFLSSFRIGTIWALSVTALSMFLGFILALLVDRRKWYSPILKILGVFPWALSPVIVAIIWEILLNPNSGFINGILRKFNLPGGNTNFLGDFNLALPTVIVIGAWIGIPVMTVTFLASFKTISKEIIEASLIDGTSNFQRMRYLLIPHMRPVITALFALNIIWNFNSFGLVYILTSGGPGGRTYVPALFVYDESFKYGNFGYASAMGLIITVALVVILGIYVFARNRNEVEA